MKEVIELLQLWQAYLEEGHEPHLERFSIWLQKQFQSSEGVSEIGIPTQYQLSLNMSIGFALGQIIAYGEIWTKVAFRELPIEHFHDFGTLKFIEEHGNPSKKEIAEDSLLEQSSCFEALKRMTKKGLLTESSDEYDKRVRRVALTQQGKEVIEKAMKQAYQLSELLVGDLREDEKRVLIKMLQKLGNFHSDLYRSGGKEKAISIYKL